MARDRAEVASRRANEKSVAKKLPTETGGTMTSAIFPGCWRNLAEGAECAVEEREWGSVEERRRERGCTETVEVCRLCARVGDGVEGFGRGQRHSVVRARHLVVCENTGKLFF